LFQEKKLLPCLNEAFLAVVAEIMAALSPTVPSGHIEAIRDCTDSRYSGRSQCISTSEGKDRNLHRIWIGAKTQCGK
jgi:hypothetical protein